MTNEPDFIDTIIDEMGGYVDKDYVDTTRADVRAAIERAIRETRPMVAVDPGDPEAKPVHVEVGEDGRWRIGARLATDEETADAIWGSPDKRILSLDLDTGQWYTPGVQITSADALRVVSSLMPGWPAEEVDKAYIAYMERNDPQPGVPIAPDGAR